MNKALYLSMAQDLLDAAALINLEDTVLACQDSAYGDLESAATKIMNYVYGDSRGYELYTDMLDSYEPIEQTVEYRRNCDHAEAIETADAEMAERESIDTSRSYSVLLDGETEWKVYFGLDVLKLIAAGTAATYQEIA